MRNNFINKLENMVLSDLYAHAFAQKTCMFYLKMFGVLS